MRTTHTRIRRADVGAPLPGLSPGQRDVRPQAFVYAWFAFVVGSVSYPQPTGRRSASVPSSPTVR